MQKHINLLNETINYFEENKYEKKVLFIHGFRSSATSFNSLKKLQRNYDMIALDLPGHGDSTFNDKITFEEYVNIVKEFIIKKNLSNLIVVGHSLGGAISIAISKMNEIKDVIAIAPFNPFLTEKFVKESLKMLSPKVFDDAKKTLSLLVQNKAKKEYFENIDAGAKSFLNYVNFTRERFSYLLLNQICSYQFHKSYLYECFLNGAASKITILNGTKDFFIPIESSTKAAQKFGYKLIPFPGIGHSLVFESAQKVNNILNEI